MIELVTCSYGEYRPEMGMPIRTSVGTPKWFTHQMMSWENVYPKYHWLHLPIEDYRQRYLAKLADVGVDTLRDDVDFMAKTYAEFVGVQPKTGVLLCFEKLSKDGAWCHRTMLATWLQENMGCTVAEFGAQPAPPAEGLFDL